MCPRAEAAIGPIKSELQGSNLDYERTMATRITEDIYLRAFSNAGPPNRHRPIRWNIFAIFFSTLRHSNSNREVLFEVEEPTRDEITRQKNGLEPPDEHVQSSANLMRPLQLTQLGVGVSASEQEADDTPADPGYVSSEEYLSESRVLAWLPAVVLVLTLMVVALTLFYVVEAKLNRNAWPGMFQESISNTLQFQALPENDGIRLSWNRSIAKRPGALSGILDITDGRQQREIKLSSSEIATGSIFYKNPSAQVTFRLRVQTGLGTTLSQYAVSR